MLKRGFTLIELLVVASIIIILTTTFFANYRGGERQFSLTQSAQKLAQDLRTTEEMALAGEKWAGVFPSGGYGIYFTNNSNSYILFADLDGDKEYDVGEKVKDLFLEENVIISSISPSSPLNITVFPPNPTVTIKPSGQSAVNSATITITLAGKTKTITINIVGLIDVD